MCCAQPKLATRSLPSALRLSQISSRQSALSVGPMPRLATSHSTRSGCPLSGVP
ncbi:MAG: hypothetical protein AW07_04186 [Candidatus Accumulibacter sp. SK-11]|nr:MAG: hypothetical protein AW07_04186 [Candidatus Accumulibacter sp. SK-11]